MSNTYLECENRSAITTDDSNLLCKVYVYIKAGDIDLLAVNNLVSATQDENGDITVDSIEVLHARKIASGNEEYIDNFEWSDLPAVETCIAQYLKQEMVA